MRFRRLPPPSARVSHGPGVFKVDYALSAPIPWVNNLCREAGTIHVGGNARRSGSGGARRVGGEAHGQAVGASSRSLRCSTPRARRGKARRLGLLPRSAWIDVDRLEAITGQIERFAPGFRDCVLASHTMNGGQLEAYNANNIGGDIVGGVTDGVSSSRVRLPLESLHDSQRARVPVLRIHAAWWRSPRDVRLLGG
jgi:phytoene dehydrogenase-like protein